MVEHIEGAGYIDFKSRSDILGFLFLLFPKQVILAEGAMTEAHLRMLVEKIYVQETDGKLSLDIQIKAPFRTHLDVYENGTLTERYGALDFDWDRLARLLYGDGLVG